MIIGVCALCGWRGPIPAQRPILANCRRCRLEAWHYPANATEPADLLRSHNVHHQRVCRDDESCHGSGYMKSFTGNQPDPASYALRWVRENMGTA